MTLKEQTQAAADGYATAWIPIYEAGGPCVGQEPALDEDKMKTYIHSAYNSPTVLMLEAALKRTKDILEDEYGQHKFDVNFSYIDEAIAEIQAARGVK